MQNGILPLAETTVKLLKQNHPQSAPSSEEVLLPNQPESIPFFKKHVFQDSFNVSLKFLQFEPEMFLKCFL